MLSRPDASDIAWVPAPSTATMLASTPGIVSISRRLGSGSGRGRQ
jgi:hypothetical protein